MTIIRKNRLNKLDMKKILITVMAAAAALSITSCDPSENTVSAVSANVIIDESGLESGVSVETYVVTFTNAYTGLRVVAGSENGIATADELTPGLYNILVSGQYVDGTVYIISGSATDVNISSDGQNITIAVAATEQSALIFKEIYYAGSGGDFMYMRDQFYEIYNNSDETVYVDGLCIAETIFADGTFTVRYQYPIENPDYYVFVNNTIWQIPGSGTDYPVAPGESIVIAQWGTDHTVESLSQGNSKVDLSGADFEALEGATEAFDGTVITDNAAINMIAVVNPKGYTTPQWLTSTSGSQYIIFKPTEALRTSDFLVATNDETTMSTALEIPISEVIDAVQAVSGPERLNFLGLPTLLDAGTIWVDSPGSYTGQSISRKILNTENGINIYQDTNNTSDDFEVNDTPVIRRNGAGVPSWNIWYTAE